MGRSFLGKNGGFGGICPKGPVEHVLEWGYTCNLLEPQSSSQLTKFKLSRQLKIWFPKNSWILACKPSDKTSLGLHGRTRVQLCNHLGAFKWRHICYSPATWKPPSDCTAVPGYGRASQVTKTSLGLHAKIYDFFGEWKKMQTQQQPYPGYSRRNNQNYASVTWTCTAVPGYSRRNNQN